MPVLSYIAIPQSGMKNELLQELNGLRYCEAFPADNVDILVLVTDTPDMDTEDRVRKQLKEARFLESLSMTFGYNDEHQKGEGDGHEDR